MHDPLVTPTDRLRSMAAAEALPLRSNPRAFRDLATALLVALLVLVVLTFRDFGITHDEEVQNVYGKKLLAYYTSFFADRSNFEYIDLFRYGGFFDLIAALLNLVSPLGEYETRHLLGGLIGVVGVVGTWRLGRLLAGERAGCLALLLIALLPAYIGHSFNNPKDAPFAAAMVWTVYYLCRLVGALPARPPWGLVVKFGLALGIALGIRVGALLVLPYLAFALLLVVLSQWRRRGAAVTSALGGAGRLAAALPIAYAVMALFWPWAYQAPLNPIAALRTFSHQPLNIDTLIDGQWVKASNLPSEYLPEYLTVKLPELVLVGLLLAAFYGFVWMARRRPETPQATREIQYAVVALAAVFPVAFFVLARPTAYNGIRHFLFVVPPLAVLAAVGIDRLWRDADRRAEWLGKAVSVGLAAVLSYQVWLTARLHPDQYIYYNLLAGGVQGAEDRYELDYWSNSLHEAANALAEYVEMEAGDNDLPRPYKVAVCGNQLSAAYFFPPYMKLTRNVAEADFLISFTQNDCDSAFPGRQIVSIERFGVELSLVKDRRHLLGK